MFGCQQVLLTDTEIFPYLEYLCSEANKLTNIGTYYARQLFFKTGKLIGKYDLDTECKSNPHFRALCAQSAQQVLRSVAESFASYRKLIAKYWKGELTDKPKLPNYRTKDGLAVIAYPKQALALKNGMVYFPLGRQVNAWFNIKNFCVAMPSNLKFENTREVRILPRNGCYYAEFVYELPAVQSIGNPENVLGIDPGLGNWLTCVSNLGKSFIIDGLKIKSMNQLYNKQVATIKKGQPQGFWNEELASITEKRNRQMRDVINKAARFVINWCISKQVGIVVFGWNQGNKDSINIGKRNNQEFVQIPTARLKTRIEQLCNQYGIKFVETEESYTSKASFLDGDFLPKFGEKPEGWKESGKRVKRGLYRSANGAKINADCNGAANILRKVATQLGINLAEVGRAVLTLPQRYDLFSSLRRSYRIKCEATRLKTVA